ncbi:MAG: sporulation transcriptional regulator SpoIIID [Monoglobales bacterium]
MKDYIEKRAVLLAKYIIENKATVRDAAKHLSVSKSTVHTDITERLPRINPSLAKSAKEIMLDHKQTRHLRGGMATKLKYERKKEALKT